MDLSGLSAISTGFQEGNLREDAHQSNLELVKQQKLQTQQQMDEQAALMALGRAFGVAPPDQPALQGAGQPSQPASQPAPPPIQAMQPPPGPPPMAPQPASLTTTGGQAPAPPGTYFNPAAAPPPAGPQAQAQPQPQQAPAPQPPRPAPPPGAASQPPMGAPPGAGQGPGAPPGGPAPMPQGGPPPAPQGGANGPVIPGQMTVQDLATRIIRANPDIQKRPDILVRAMTQAQKLLAPDEKIAFAIQKTQMDFQAKMEKLDNDRTIQDMKNTNTLDKQQAAIESATQKLQLTQDFQMKLAQFKDQLTGNRQDRTQATKTRADLLKDARKSGVNVTPEMSDNELQNLVAAKNASEKGGAVPPSVAQFYGQALINHDLPLLRTALSYSKNRVETMGQFIAAAQEIDPSFTADKSTVNGILLGAATNAVKSTQQTVTNVQFGANEIKQTLPLAIASAKQLDLTQFPTVNKLKNAAARGGLGQDKQKALAQLETYENAIQTAYARIKASGRASTVFDKKQAQDLVNGDLPVSVLLAKGDAMLKEAAANEKAGQETIKSATSAIGGRSGAKANAAKSGGSPPPFPATGHANGTKATSPDGAVWIVQDGEWVQQQ